MVKCVGMVPADTNGLGDGSHSLEIMYEMQKYSSS